MSLECGIVGLPNVGKSTLFNTLTSAQVAAENFPFCTVDPNRGVVEVPDPRVDQIVEIVKPKNVVRSYVQFVDIAGLVKGASKGEGLGNQFLSHIRNVDAIVHVVRCFEDDQITHVMGDVNPERDVETVDLELCLSDLERVQNRIEKLGKLAKSGNLQKKEELAAYQKLLEKLDQGIPVRRIKAEFEDLDLSDLVTAKPLMYLANLSENDLVECSPQVSNWLKRLEEISKKDEAPVISLSAALEFQLSQLEEGSDKQMFMEEYKLKEPGMHRFVREAYKLLGLISFFTAGEKEVRAWTIPQGARAVDAAGTIHTDFAKGFIRAEIIHYEDFIACRGEKVAREKGLQRAEGRDYLVRDGDVILFRFNV